LAARLSPDPLGELTRSPRLPRRNRGPTSKGREGRGRGEEGGERREGKEREGGKERRGGKEGREGIVSPSPAPSFKILKPPLGVSN